MGWAWGGGGDGGLGGAFYMKKYKANSAHPDQTAH